MRTMKLEMSHISRRLALLAATLLVLLMCSVHSKASDRYTVSVQSGYLALRTAKAFDYNNEIGKLYTGDVVDVKDYSDRTYWWVYAPSLGREGYVNCNYLIGGGSSSSGSSRSTSGSTIGTATVSVQSGYLALRNAKAFDYSNEIGKLYTGQTVQIRDTSEGLYWWVYAPTLGREGYVNSEYLINVSWSGSNRSTAPSRSTGGYLGTMTVRVDSGYLALRTAKAYDYSNEIGKLYTGETVQVIDTSEGLYWWVYAPSLGREGYVNSDYLVGSLSGGGRRSSGGGFTKTVHVQSGYLALRTAKAFDSSNEIGKLYTGQTVQVLDTSEGLYWWVYAPTLGREGYVNSDYLY